MSIFLLYSFIRFKITLRSTQIDARDLTCFFLYFISLLFFLDSASKNKLKKKLVIFFLTFIYMYPFSQKEDFRPLFLKIETQKTDLTQFCREFYALYDSFYRIILSLSVLDLY